MTFNNNISKSNVKGSSSGSGSKNKILYALTKKDDDESDDSSSNFKDGYNIMREKLRKREEDREDEESSGRMDYNDLSDMEKPSLISLRNIDVLSREDQCVVLDIEIDGRIDKKIVRLHNKNSKNSKKTQHVGK